MNQTFNQCPACHSLNKVLIEKALENKAICGLVSEVNSKNFQKILSLADKPVVVDFWASWCGPCRVYAPEYERASKENQNAIFLKINTEEEQQLSAAFGIRGIPCTLIFKNSKEVKRQSGAMSADQLKSFINN
jgi:thioredoxin 2